MDPWFTNFPLARFASNEWILLSLDWLLSPVRTHFIARVWVNGETVDVQSADTLKPSFHPTLHHPTPPVHPLLPCLSQIPTLPHPRSSADVRTAVRPATCGFVLFVGILDAGGTAGPMHRPITRAQPIYTLSSWRRNGCGITLGMVTSTV